MISFIAILSVNLGLVNLLPDAGAGWGTFNVLRGFEAVRGRPDAAARRRNMATASASRMIASPVRFRSSWNDLVREGAFHWVARLRG